jgi:hypothetical protein
MKTKSQLLDDVKKDAQSLLNINIKSASARIVLEYLENLDKSE